MGIRASLRAQAQAAVSAAEADVIELATALRRATVLLDSAHSADTLLGAVKEESLLAPVASALRREMAVDRARLRADVDQLTADLQVARNRLRLARGWQQSVQRVLRTSTSSSPATV